MSAVIATITIGNTKRIPNTATIIPTVKNSFFQNGSQFLSTDALTIALSNESDTSITANMAVMASAFSIADTPADVPCVKPQ